MKTGEIFVAGKWQATRSGETYQPINPANEEPIAAVGKGDERDIDLAVTAARKAFDEGPWPKMSAHERGRIVWRLGDLIQQNLDEMARLESLCTGKTMFDSGKVEIPFAAEVFRYYAGWATKIHGETLGLRDNAFTFTLRQPVGVVGAIVPWNFPFLLSSWKIAPALAAGNTIVIKPASQTPLTALRFAEICQEAGVPEGVFNVVTGPGGKVGMALVRDPRVDKIAFTGSTEVGKQIMREAAGTLKRLSLELGGKSPNIVFADADMDAAVRGALTGIFYNKGEVCAAGSRLFLEESIHDQFMSKLADRVKSLKVGDPMDKATRMGPVISKGQMETVLSYIESGKQEGARVVAGGGRADVGTGKGYFIQPTIFDGVTNEDEDRPRGDLRPGAVGDPVPLGRGRHRAGQPHRLRPGRRGVDARRLQGAQGGQGDPGGHGVGQHLQPLRSGAAVRRLQGVGLRPRDGVGGARQLHRGQDRLGRLVVAARPRTGMRSPSAESIRHDLVLVGGGHGHIRSSSAGPWPRPGGAPHPRGGPPDRGLLRHGAGLRSRPVPTGSPRDRRPAAGASRGGAMHRRAGHRARTGRGASSWTAGHRSPTTPCPSTWAPRWPGSGAGRPRARDPHASHRGVRPPRGRGAGRRAGARCRAHRRGRRGRGRRRGGLRARGAAPGSAAGRVEVLLLESGPRVLPGYAASVCGLVDVPPGQVHLVRGGRSARLPSFVPDERKVARIDGCETCSSYVKTFDLREAGAIEVVPLVDDVATVSLDLWANDQGLARHMVSFAGV